MILLDCLSHGCIQLYLIINAKDIKNREIAEDLLDKAKNIFDNTLTLENQIIAYIDERI